MQNIIIEKDTGMVESITIWADGRRLKEEEYPGKLLIYIEDEEEYLDMTKVYKYKDGRFEEYIHEIKTESILQELKNENNELRKQILQLQSMYVEDRYKNVLNNKINGGV